MSVVHSHACSDVLIVISPNIEDLSANKASILSERCKKEHCHFGSSDYAMARIANMTLVAESLHNKYGSAVFIKKDLKVNGIYVCKQGTLKLITVEIHGDTLPKTMDDGGNAVKQWTNSCNLTLVHNAKLPKSFNKKIEGIIQP